MNIKLEKLLWGGEQGIPAARYSYNTKNYLRSSTPIKETPHVKLLESYQTLEKALFQPEHYEKTPYYHNLVDCIEECGNYFEVTNKNDAIKQIKRFIDHFEGKEAEKIYHQSDDKPPLIAPNQFSDYFEVIDGMHRIAIAYVNGVEEMEFRVSSQPTMTFLQELILGNSWTSGQKLLYQPICSPELENFTLVRQCSDRFEMMSKYLKEKELLNQGLKYLDLGSSYGYFLAEMAKLGFESYGVDKCANSLMLGTICYQVPQKRMLCMGVENFFDLNEDHYDVVSLLSVLHHFLLGRGRISAKELIEQVDKITKRVLILDSGQNHEGWFKDTLPNWDEKTMIQWLKDHTSFDEVIPLGKDSDNVGVYAPNYQRTLIACYKSL